MNTAAPTQEKQPAKLFLIALISIWERYGYYSMQAMVVLYMVKILGFSNADSYKIFAVFSALFYLMPIIGGYIADKYWGFKKSVIIGGALLTAGYALLAAPGSQFFYAALAIISVGGGLFISNIASLVSNLYRKEDGRREGGFSLFYTSINVGAFFPPIISVYVITAFGWRAAFMMASISVFISVFITFFWLNESHNVKNSKNWLVRTCPYLAIGALIALLTLLIKHSFHANLIIFSFSAVFIILTIAKSFFYTKQEKNKLHVCLLLIVLSIVFGVLYQQAAMSLTLYTEYNVHRNLGDWIIPTIAFRSLNPFFIILLGPLLAKLWVSLSERWWNPSVAIKFGLGTFFMGLGFVVLFMAISWTASNGKIDLSWIVLSYLLQTLGEMLVSPIGLSMVSELAPAAMLSLMMGTWYFATAVSDALAGFVSIWTTVPSGSNEAIQTSTAYAHTFGTIGMTSLAVGIAIMIFSPVLCAKIGKKSFGQ